MSTKIVSGNAPHNIRPFNWAHVAGDSRSELPEEHQTLGAIATPHQLRMRMEELERTMEAKCQEALQNGHRAGEASAQQQANARVEGAVARLGQSLAELGALRAKVRREAEEDIVRLSLEI